MFGQLGSLVWSPFTFLWSYVTLPTLLVLLTIYFLNLYYSGSPYYVSWNDSMVRPLPVGTWGPSTPPCISYPQRPGDPKSQAHRHRPPSYISDPTPGTWGNPALRAPRLSPPCLPCGPLSLSPEP